ncbi:MAG: methyl-accepting chemotaxis protein [Leptospiraceae bacterium]|nr:methyl-accepting chemotaxis protein [Leptospiraceae bacterium]
MNKLFSPLKASLLLQFFSYGLGVPLAATVLAIIMNFDSESFTYFVFAVIFGVSFSMVIFPFRFYHLKSFLEEAANPNKAKDIKQLKIKLLKYPYLDSRYIVQITWLIGVSTHWFFYSFLKGRLLLSEWPMMAVYLVVFFINSTAQFFLAEWVMGQYLALPEFAKVQLKENEYPKMTMSKKIFMTAFSVAWYFLLILVYILYAVYANKIQVNTLGLYFLPVIFILGIILSGAFAFFFNKSVERSLTILKEDLNNLVDGKLYISARLINTDETGALSYFVSGIQSKLIEVISQIQSEADNLEDVSKKISAMSETNLESIEVQANTTKEISRSIQNIHNMMKITSEKSYTQSKASNDVHSYLESLEEKINFVNKSSGNALNKSASVRNHVETGQKAMENTKEAMSLIQKSTEKVMNITTVINELSDQIGMLALNASIEAARAAEKGKGFSVVAHEVSKLGDITNKNAKEINTLIKGSIKNVNNGEKSIALTGENFSSIDQSFKDVDSSLVEIKNISDEQFRLKDEIMLLFSNLKKLSEEISFSSNEEEETLNAVNSSITILSEKIEDIQSGSREVFKVANHLLEQAKKLKNGIARFEIR